MVQQGHLKFARHAARVALLTIAMSCGGVAHAAGSASASFDESMEGLFAEVERLLAELTAQFDQARGTATAKANSAATARQASYQAAVTAANQQKAAAIAAAEQRHAAAVAAAAERVTQELAENDARHQQAQAEAVANYQRQVADLGNKPVSSFRRIPGGLAGELERTQQRLEEERKAAAAAIQERARVAKEASAADYAAAVAKINSDAAAELEKLAKAHQSAVAAADAGLAAELAALELQYANLKRETEQYREDKLSELTGTPPAAVPLQLTWTVPASRVSGEPLSMAELAGYELYYSGADNGLSGVITISVPDQTGYALSGLQAGRYFFAISAVDQAGLKSDLSPMVEVVVP